MNHEIIKILTLQIASIISPIILSVTLLILSNKKNAILNTLTFFLGSILVAIIITLLGFVAGRYIAAPNIHTSFGKFIDLILSLIFLFFAIKLLFSKNQNNDNTKKAIGSTNFLKIGFMLNIVNISSIATLFAASKEIPLANLDLLTIVFLIILGLICFTAPIIVPLVIYLIFPKTAQNILAPINKFFNQYSKYIISILFFVFAIYFISEFINFHL